MRSGIAEETPRETVEALLLQTRELKDAADTLADTLAWNSGHLEEVGGSAERYSRLAEGTGANSAHGQTPKTGTRAGDSNGTEAAERRGWLEETRRYAAELAEVLEETLNGRLKAETGGKGNTESP